MSLLLELVMDLGTKAAAKPGIEKNAKISTSI